MYASGAYICAYAIERRISTRIGGPHLREGVIEMVEAWGRSMPLILKYEPDVKFREMADIFIAAFDRRGDRSGFDEEHSPVARGTTVGGNCGGNCG